MHEYGEYHDARLQRGYYLWYSVVLHRGTHVGVCTDRRQKEGKEATRAATQGVHEYSESVQRGRLRRPPATWLLYGIGGITGRHTRLCMHNQRVEGRMVMVESHSVTQWKARIILSARLLHGRNAFEF